MIRTVYMNQKVNFCIEHPRIGQCIPLSQNHTKYTPQKKKNCAPCEDRTHDLEIMRLTRYLLR